MAISKSSRLILCGLGIPVFILFLLGIRELTSTTTNPPLGQVVKLAKIHYMTMDTPRAVPAREFEFYDRGKYPSLLVPLKDERGNNLTAEVTNDPTLPPGTFRLVQRHVEARTYESVHYPGYDYVIAEYHLSQDPEPQSYIPHVKPRH